MTPSKHELCGVLPVFQTPWLEDETLDLETLEREIDWLYDCGAHGIVMAIVSETLRLDSDEREQLAAAACKFGKSRGAVVISVGAESSKVAERYAKHAESVGADAVMAIPPVSIGIGESELLAYYIRIIHAIQIPVIVQDASGYVGKDSPGNALVDAIHKVLDGGVYVSERLAAHLAATFAMPRPRGSTESPLKQLSDREFQVFELFGHGKTAKEIAAQLHLSPKTVSVHRDHIKDKMGFVTSAEMIRQAVRWVETQPEVLK